MTIEIKVPVLPESVQDATIATWHKKPGDAVKRNENLVDLETDKVVLEVPAPADGILQDILQQQGATVTANMVLATLEPGAKANNTAAAKAPEAKAPEAKAPEAKAPEAKAPAAKAPEAKAPAAAANNAAAKIGPAARRRAGAADVELTTVAGSGKDGKITAVDVNQATTAPAPATSAQSAVAPGQPSMNSITASADLSGRLEQRVPMTRLRARIAERLVAAQHSAAILTTFNEINMQPVMDARAQYKDQFEKAYGVRLGFMSFFVRACVEALKRMPIVNASIDGNDVIYHGYFDIGVAVSTERGLMVPILRDADKLSSADIEARIVEFGNKAQKGQIDIADLTGGTFTISNGGVFGSLLSTPIINPPQSAILGMHKIEKRAVVEDDTIVIRPCMYVALSYDHRIIDGKESVTFLRTVKELLEDPQRILLEI